MTCGGTPSNSGSKSHASTATDQDVTARIRRVVESGLASGHLRGTPTLFIDGVVHVGGYDAATLMEALAE
jgi:protein-disulfide isomerase